MTTPELPPLDLHCESGRAHAAYTPESVEARESILVAEIERLRAKCEAMRAGYVPVSALIEARDHVEDWAAYSSPYFREKHDLAGVLAEIDAQIAAAQAQQPAAAVPAGYVSMPVERVQHVIDLLAERAHLNNARSPAHNARLLLEATMTAALVQQPAAAVPEGWRVMWFTGTVTRDSERWEVYDPDGNGGAVDKGDVRDDMVRGLLDALAAANKENNNGNS